MSASINEGFVYEFESLVHHLGQQKVSRLMNTVRVKMDKAEKFHFERVAASNMVSKVGTRNNYETPINDVVHSRRVATPVEFAWGEAIDPADAARILIDPNSTYVESASMAWGRTIDGVITAAAVATAATGIGGTGAGVALPGAQSIGGAATTMSLDLLRQAKRKMDEAEVDGNRYLALTSKALEDLLKVTEVTSSDYNTVRALVYGDVDTYLGFKFIRTELLPVGGAADRRRCIAYTDKAIGLCLPIDKFSRIGEDPSRSFMTRIYLETLVGAVRIEDAGVVSIEISGH